MKKRHLYIYLPILVGLFFWACGSGSLEWAENDDILALEKFDNMSEDEILLALDSCVARGECDKESSEAFRRSLLAKDTVEDDPVESSSSSLDIFGMSSSADSSVVSSSTVLLSSSSGTDLVSSSGGILSSSSDSLSSSSVALSSIGPVVSSSSKPLLSSSSVVLSSSSFVIKLSSSAPPVVSSSSAADDLCTTKLLGQGQYRADKSTIKLGEEATWTYTPVVECREGLTATWLLMEADVTRMTGLSAKFRFTDDPLVGEKVYPTLTLKRGGLSVTMDCDKAQVKIEAGVIPSSSSIIRSSSSSVIKSSSSHITEAECKMDAMDVNKWTCTKPGREDELCVKNAQDKWVCPVPGVSSSSVTPPSSSSVVPPSSSSQESSSSVEPPPPSSSSQGPIEITAPGTLAEANQEYSMTHSCGTEFQFSPPQNNGSCSVVINGETIAIGYYKNYPTSPGTYILKSDCGGVTVRCY